MAKDLKNSVGIVETKILRVIDADAPLKLSSGKTLGPIDVAYETYGQLSDKADNVVLICHALSGIWYALPAHTWRPVPLWYSPPVHRR